MLLRIISYIALAFLLLTASCKKEKEDITFEFEILTEDYYSGDPIGSVSVQAYTKGVSSGTFNNTFQLQASETTNGNGTANLNVPYGGIEVVKFTFDKEGYFNQIVEYNPDDFTTNSVNELTIPIKKEGYISFRIRNAFPISGLDEMTFNSLNADCQECVKFNSLDFYGTNVDTTIAGTIVASRYYKYQYIVTKNGTPTNYLDSAYCDTDTTFVQINY